MTNTAAMRWSAATLSLLAVCSLVLLSASVQADEGALHRFRRDTSFYADGSIDYENTDFEDDSALSPPRASAPAMAPPSGFFDDRNDAVLEARKSAVESDVTDITNPEYFKEARANAEHIRNMGTIASRQRSNDKARDSAADENSGLAGFLAAHAIKDEAIPVITTNDWRYPERSVPQMAAGMGEYELRSPPVNPVYAQPPPAYAVPAPMPQPQMPYAQGYYQAQPMAMQAPYAQVAQMVPVVASPVLPNVYNVDPAAYELRALRPPNSNAVYARAMAVGMKPVGPPLHVTPAAPSLISNFRPSEFQEMAPEFIGTYSNEAYETLEPLGDARLEQRPPMRRNVRLDAEEESDEDDTTVDDSKLEDLPEPVEDQQQAKVQRRLAGGKPGTNDYFYYNMFGGAGNMEGDAAFCPPGRDCSKKGGDVKVVHLPSGKTLKVKTNNQGKINVAIEGGDSGTPSTGGGGPDPQALEEHMKNALINAASVKEQIAMVDNAKTWDMTTSVTVSLGFLLAGIAGIMGFTIMNQRARAAERQDSTTIQSRSNSKVELGQDLSDYCYREDVRRLAHILEDD